MSNFTTIERPKRTKYYIRLTDNQRAALEACGAKFSGHYIAQMPIPYPDGTEEVAAFPVFSRRVESTSHRFDVTSSNRAEWSAWDWSKRDITLSREHRMTRERVRQIRVLLGKPKNNKFRWGRSDHEETQIIKSCIDSIPAIDRGHTGATAVVEKTGFSLAQVIAVANRMGVDLGRPFHKHRWNRIDWSLPNCVLADCLGVYESSVSRFRRRVGVSSCNPAWRYDVSKRNQWPEILASAKAYAAAHGIYVDAPEWTWERPEEQLPQPQQSLAAG